MKCKIWQNLHTFLEIHIYPKKFNTSNVIYWGNFKYFKNMLQKKSFKKSFLWKSQIVKKVHLRLSLLSTLAHLIMIAPKYVLFFTSMFFVFPSKPLECNLIIFYKKMIVLINATILMKKIKILELISQILMFIILKIYAIMYNIFYSIFD
jgi:hypothetical protein